MGEERSYDGKNPIYPPITYSLDDKTKDEGRDGNSHGHEQGPNSHVPTTFSLEECLLHDSTAETQRRRDEPRDKSPVYDHGGIRWTLGAANIAD